MYNIQARSYNYCSTGNAVRNTYSEGMFVAVGIQHAIRMRHTVICGLHGYKKIFFHIT
jgi:hypothetical protein